MSGPLYIIIRHRDDTLQKYRRPQYRNRWFDDDRVERITTTPHVAGECKKQMESDEIVYVHRCGWKPKGKPPVPPTISCSVRVTKIEGSYKNPVVHFSEVKKFSPRPATAE